MFRVVLNRNEVYTITKMNGYINVFYIKINICEKSSFENDYEIEEREEETEWCGDDDDDDFYQSQIYWRRKF